MRADQVFSEPQCDKCSCADGRTPVLTARALKVTLYAGAALAMWGLYRFSRDGEESPPGDPPEEGTPEARSADAYSTWEPSQ